MKNFQEITFVPPAAQEKKITLNLKQIATPPPAPKPQPKPIIVPPKPMPKPVQPQPVIEKKVEPKPEVQPVKEKILDERNKTFAKKSTEENNVTKIEAKPKKKLVKKEIKKPAKKAVKKPTKKVVKKVIKKKKVVKRRTKPRKVKRSIDPLANMLMGAGTSMIPKSRQSRPRRRPSSSAGSYGEQMIKKLYGAEFNTYSPTQKKFIRNNLSTIHRITQNTLSRNGYPSVAVRTRQQGTNVVSFYLHPNGDISGLRLKTPIGYAALDKNTLNVIRIAYKNYPLPNKKTRIVFFVTYSLY